MPAGQYRVSAAKPGYITVRYGQREEADPGAVLDVADAQTRTRIDAEFRFIRDPFRLSPGSPLVSAFQASYEAISGAPLPLAAKPFVDDGNSFYGLGPIPAITHGPRAAGQHTVNEWVDMDDMARVAVLYALTAVTYLRGQRSEVRSQKDSTADL